ncbi:TonB family protein, partial [Rhodoplanes sp. TEM]
EPPAAVMIELSPLAVAPDAPQQEVALGPTMVASQAAAPSQREDDPVETEEPEPEPEPVPIVKTEVELPPVPEKPNAAAVLPAEAKREADPDPPKDLREKPEPKRKRKTRDRPRTRAALAAPTTAAPQAANLRRASTNAAPTAGTSSSVAPSTWRGLLTALLNRHKRFPPGGGHGTAMVAFTIDRAGRVLSARLVRSAGDPALDQEAVALARRVSPVPPPPAEIAGRTISLAVPVRFDR